MQIPYDLEFIENRPVSRVRAIAMPHPFAPAADRRRDAFDALLSWLHRVIHRLEKPA